MTTAPVPGLAGSIPTDAPGPSRLLVYVPSLNGGTARPAAFLFRLREALGPGWRVETWDHKINALSIRQMAEVARELAVRIRTWSGDNGVGDPVDEVILVGHSMGGILARHAFLLDSGCMGGPTPPQRWTTRTTRVVLLAAPNAGFRDGVLPLGGRLVYPILSATGRFTVEALRTGSPYLTELRLRWVDASRRHMIPTVVQVVGDRDRLVSLEDSIDIDFLPNSIQLEVPGAGHGDLVDLKSARDPDERFGILRHAIMGGFSATDTAPRPPETRNVYMLLHGIRYGDFSGWVRELSGLIAKSDREALVYTPSYGYFGAFQFALPLARKRNLRRFLDWYCDMYVRTTESSEINFAGHSNGTYIVGRALLSVPAIHFDRVYLAGSVLPREFDWTRVTEYQVKQAYSVRASRDWAVGWLCAFLRGLRMRDVGTGGFTGFDDQPKRLHQPHHALDGGHGAALTSPRLPAVATYLRTGEEPKVAKDEEKDATPAFARVGRLLGATAVPLVVLLAVGLGYATAAMSGLGRAVFVLALLAGLWTVGRAL